jgi:O-antigen/teichoic acid export membrane protein
MAAVRWNILANLIGGAWATVLTLLIIPIQVKILGMEAFGLVGLIATLQIIFNVLDLGLSATITRSVASDTSSNHEHSREIVQTAATLYWGIALLIGVLLGRQAGWVADNWFNLKELSPDTVRMGIQVIALSLALRWPVTLYAGVISGLQRLEILNLLKSAVITVRLVGGVLVLLVFHDLTVFLIWTAISAFVEIVSYAIVCCRIMPELSLRPYLSYRAVKEVWHFSLGMNLIAILAMVLTQTDRILISKLLPLESLGCYFLAYNTAIGISLIPSAINSAMFPSFSSDYGHDGKNQLISRYDKATQINAYLISLLTFFLVFFGYDVLRFWISTEVAERTYRVMGILSFGLLLHASITNCYSIATASGNPYLVLKINVFGFLCYVPCLYLLIYYYGIYGGAFASVFLGVYYLTILLPAVHKIILKQPVLPWFSQNLLPFLILGLISFGGMRVFLLIFLIDHLFAVLASCIIAILIYLTVGYYLLKVDLRSDIRTFLIQMCDIAFCKAVR